MRLFFIVSCALANTAFAQLDPANHQLTGEDQEATEHERPIAFWPVDRPVP